ncbi:choline-binding transcriptional repressor BetI [Histidinibacterium lentulum]|uniref:HTH-type transcriptional regulator BetI n=1 Tax=Histidinibacterium lentulum TaxID=2480588 RepID=A0A3N2R897_9RHOB|nr:transcriptional regulator BetI [Histidinibacterium lentulum]ROU03657.1 transcriptional regulator BetI [Histidinibacterium lentulum]
MGVESKRKAELIAAAIAEIGEAGTLDVTVGRIAKRAGVSPALAFHYFGDKDRLFLAAMRHILADYGRDVRNALRAADGPRARLDALIGASFGPANFERGAAAAWLNFYVLAQHVPEARRLLTVYQRRLHSNLLHDLRPLAGARSDPIARRIGALIDGLYLRSVHAVTEVSREEAAALVRQTLDQSLETAR